MTDKNVFGRTGRSTPGSNRITTMKILDLTDGQGDVSVTLTSKRSINQADDKSEAKRLKLSAETSPWSDSRLGRAFANKSLSTRKNKDPIKELKKFTESITRKG